MRPGEEPIIDEHEHEHQGDDDDDEGRDPSAMWTEPVVAGRALRWVSAGAAVLWALTVGSGLVYSWTLTTNEGFPSGTGRLPFAVMNSLAGAWGYLLVSVGAYVASVLLVARDGS